MIDTLGADIKAAIEKVDNEIKSPQSQESELLAPVSEGVSEEEVNHATTSSSEPEPEIEAPAHWANEDREVFKSLDVKGRDFLLRRHKQMEADHTRKLQAHAEDVKIAENYRKKLTPHEGYIKTIGIDPFDAFEKLVGAEIKLRTGSPEEKQQILHTLARQYGVQFEHDDTQPEIDQKTQLILQKLDQTEKTVLQLKQEREAEVQRGLQNHINEFTSQVNDKGLPKYPHFEAIREEMGFLMQSGKANTLEEAYKKAIILNDDLRDEYLLSQNKNVESKKKSLDSQNATFNVKSGSASKMSDPKEDLGLDAVIRRAINAQKTRKRI